MSSKKLLEFTSATPGVWTASRGDFGLRIFKEGAKYHIRGYSCGPIWQLLLLKGIVDWTKYYRHYRTAEADAQKIAVAWLEYLRSQVGEMDGEPADEV